MSAPLLPHLRADLEQERKAHIATIVLESEHAVSTPVGSRAAGGDRARLRGVPVAAAGVGGTSPGTDPLQALLDSEPD